MLSHHLPYHVYDLRVHLWGEGSEMLGVPASTHSTPITSSSGASLNTPPRVFPRRWKCTNTMCILTTRCASWPTALLNNPTQLQRLLESSFCFFISRVVSLSSCRALTSPQLFSARRNTALGNTQQLNPNGLQLQILSCSVTPVPQKLRCQFRCHNIHSFLGGTAAFNPQN